MERHRVVARTRLASRRRQSQVINLALAGSDGLPAVGAMRRTAARRLSVRRGAIRGRVNDTHGERTLGAHDSTVRLVCSFTRSLQVTAYATSRCRPPGADRHTFVG